MNLKEFAALQVGDKIENWFPSRSVGEIVETTASGVRLRWEGNEQSFFFSVNSTAWMHWRLPHETEPDTATQEGA